MTFRTHTLRWRPNIPNPIPSPIPNPIPDLPNLSNMIKSASEAAENIRKKIGNGENLDIKDVNAVLGGFQEALPPEVTETGRQLVNKLDEVKQAIKELQELTPAELKRKILKEAEKLCESYLNDKLEIIRKIDLEGVPIVNLDFNGEEITIDLKIYITFKSDKSDYENKWGVLLETNLKQKFTDLVPSIDLTLKLNEDWTKEKLDEIKNKVEDKKNELIEGLIQSILQDYCPPLRALNEAMKIFG
ncbi:hypothetical protein [Peribacillus frigoritolerans]|uniref:hypothetical protein n=1 Tax=Peribacillus frigoritolerans TaxID=450367 RepID=UPI0025A06A10|nr:hypothetical protein [Peribacillus frigoritolerans]MDM5309822.1 hypothetical protein [Peribacillus frigoritolerans]